FKAGEAPRYEYSITDHLGNVRLQYSDINENGKIEDNSEIIWEGHYYPFGMAMHGPWMDHPDPASKYQYNGSERVDDFGLDLDFAKFRTLDPSIGRWLQIDPAAEASFSITPYNSMHNNPIRYNDPNGDFIPAAILGAGINFITNGISNSLNGDNFFKNAGIATAFGAIGGANSFGIGEVAKTFSSSLGRAAFQTLAHGVSGGAMSAIQGGSFKSGFLSGSVSSIVGSGASEIGLSQGSMIALGGMSGGIASSLGGGNFWKGLSQGVITSGLNHAAHSGSFGEGLAVSLVTGRARHILGPDAQGLFIAGDVAAGGGAHAQKTEVSMKRGPQAGERFTIDGSGLHAGYELGVSAGGENYYFSGSTQSFTINNLTGYGWQLAGSAGAFTLDVGGSVSYAKSGLNGDQFVIGVGRSIGWSTLPGKVSGT
ncbi:MAG: RHS repeat-associated core domain-containing protein, partial [Bacteroidota bacterium]